MDGVIAITAEVTDDIELERVEFYWNGQILATLAEAPFRTEWRIVKLGAQQFQVIAYDTAGNVTKSDVFTVTILN